MELVLQPESGCMIESFYHNQREASEKTVPIPVQQMTTLDLVTVNSWRCKANT